MRVFFLVPATGRDISATTEVRNKNCLNDHRGDEHGVTDRDAASIPWLKEN